MLKITIQNGYTYSLKKAVVVLTMLLFGMQLMAQSSVVNTVINIEYGSYSAKQLIHDIEESNSLIFSYSDNLLEGKRITLPVSFEGKLKDFFKDYYLPEGIAYKQLGNQLVLYEVKAEPRWFTLSGFVSNASNSENIIGAAIYIKELGIGTITNPYGFFTLKLPSGTYDLIISSLGFASKTSKVNLLIDTRYDFLLAPKTYDVSEITVTEEQNSIFLESTIMNMVKIDIKSLQEIPGLLGENDALRNLSVLPGIQTNELSTSSINVRGGGTDQTMFLMDEATLYSASHFGGFFSVFNPDVVNNVNVYKSDIPVDDEGALSSLIDIHLREGNNKQWKVKGGIGLLSARAMVEGPVKKDTSSLLVAFRRTYVDNLARLVTIESQLKDANFYFYDANFKFNYKLNKNNRIFLSGYAGSDVFSQYSQLSNKNYLGTIRWNHIFMPGLFANTTLSLSQNLMTQGTQIDKDLLYWQSEINDVKIKSDLTYYQTKDFKISFGYIGKIYNIYPYSLITKTEQTVFTRYQSALDRMMLNSFYASEHWLYDNKVGFDIGLKVTHLLTYPFTDSLVGVSDIFVQPQFRLSYAFANNSTLKFSYSRQVQPLHQLSLSMVGVSVNRWMSTSKSFAPQISSNYTLGYYNSRIKNIHLSAEFYYRNMNNLVETFQDTRILYTDDPEKYLHNAKGNVIGAELLGSFKIGKLNTMVSYDFCQALWKTDGLNGGKQYEASHTRKHTLNASMVYRFNNRISASATWVLASGIPYTAAIAKYTVENRTYLQFDNNKINTKKLPPYHRLDLSLDIASRKNSKRKWKGYWNFSVYNVYFRKNALGVAYFIPDMEDEVEVQKLNPGYFYLYQFVPSASYRFEF